MSAGQAARATLDMTRMPGKRDRQGRHAAPWLGSVCATALLLGSIMLAAGPGEAKPDNCTVNGSTVTCAGNQSAGIQSGRDFNSSNTSTLNVQNLSTDITPAGAVPGILVSNGTSTRPTSSTCSSGRARSRHLVQLPTASSSPARAALAVAAATATTRPPSPARPAAAGVRAGSPGHLRSPFRERSSRRPKGAARALSPESGQ